VVIGYLICHKFSIFERFPMRTPSKKIRFLEKKKMKSHVRQEFHMSACGRSVGRCSLRKSSRRRIYITTSPSPAAAAAAAGISVIAGRTKLLASAAAAASVSD